MTLTSPGPTVAFSLCALAFAAAWPEAGVLGLDNAYQRNLGQVYPITIALPRSDGQTGPQGIMPKTSSYPIWIPFHHDGTGKVASSPRRLAVSDSAGEAVSAEQADSRSVERIADAPEPEKLSFAKAFASLGFIKPVTGPARQAITDVLYVNFDLRQAIAASGSEGLAVRKPIFADGVARGNVELRIMADTQILVKSDDLTTALAGNGSQAPASLRRILASRDFVDLDEIRRAGLTVRYDAVRDALMLGNPELL